MGTGEKMFSKREGGSQRGRKRERKTNGGGVKRSTRGRESASKKGGQTQRGADGCTTALGKSYRSKE